MKGCVNVWVGGQKSAWVGKWVNTWVVGFVDGYADGLLTGCMCRWLSGWRDKTMSRWIPAAPTPSPFLRIPQDEQTPLHIATLCGSADMVFLLLKFGANPSMTTRDAYTALHIAAKDGRADIVQCLLASGANPDARTRVSCRPSRLRTFSYLVSSVLCCVFW